MNGKLVGIDFLGKEREKATIFRPTCSTLKKLRNLDNFSSQNVRSDEGTRFHKSRKHLYNENEIDIIS